MIYWEPDQKQGILKSKNESKTKKLLLPIPKESVLGDHDDVTERSEKGEKFHVITKSSNKNDQNLGKSGLNKVSMFDQKVTSIATISGEQLPATVCGESSQISRGKSDKLDSFSNRFAA